MDQRDIRFSQKKVDDSWKEQAKPAVDSRPGKGEGSSRKNMSSKPFLNLISSLGYQALIHLGEIEDPSSGQREVNLEAARQTIDLLVALNEKSQDHLSSEESQAFQTLLPDLQMRFSRLA